MVSASTLLNPKSAFGSSPQKRFLHIAKSPMETETMTRSPLNFCGIALDVVSIAVVVVNFSQLIARATRSTHRSAYQIESANYKFIIINSKITNLKNKLI